jgi:hypothetical protein
MNPKHPILLAVILTAIPLAIASVHFMAGAQPLAGEAQCVQKLTALATALKNYKQWTYTM